jgi:hypothetical protein
MGKHIQLEPIEVVGTRAATHLRYRVLNGGRNAESWKS